ncbi:PD-(D/E)XK nuclease family protein [Peptoniphilaceae bacterium SGI.131]
MKVVVSRSAKNNRSLILNKVKEFTKIGKRVYFVVPEQATLISEVDIYKRLNIEATVDIKIKSFRTIVDEILSVKGGRSKNFLSDTALEIILSLVLNEVKNDLKIYGKNTEDQGFISLIISLIREMKAGKIDRNKLQRIYEDEKFQGNLADKLGDLLIILDSYQEVIKNSKFEEIDKLDLACELIDETDIFANIVFIFDRFQDMSGQELDLLEKIDAKAYDSYINISMDSALVAYLDAKDLAVSGIDDYELFESSRRFLNRIRVDKEYVYADKFFNEASDVERLINSIFSYKLPEKLELSNVYINRFDNTFQEVENLGLSIKKDIIEDKLRFKDIAVVTSNTREYFPLIKRDFSINNLPFFIDDKRNLLENPMIKYLKSAIGLLGSNLSWDKIIEYLKNSFCDLDISEINIFQNYISKRKIVGNMIGKDRYFKFEANKFLPYEIQDFEDLKVVLKVRELFLNTFESFASNLDEFLNISKKEDTVEAFVKNTYDFIANKSFLENYSKYEELIKSGGFAEERVKEILDENRLVWDKFVEILEHLFNIASRRKISFYNFKAILENAIDRIKIGIIPPSQDQIIVGDISRSRLMGVKKLYILGMSNLYYPGDMSGEDFFLEEEKAYLSDEGIEFSNTRLNKLNNSKLSFYEILASASHKLVFSFATISTSGEEMGPAFIFDWIKQVIKKENISYDKPSYIDNLYSLSKLSYYLPERVKLIDDRKEMDVLERAYVLKLLENIKDNERYTFILDGINQARKSFIKELLSKEVGERIYRKDKISITELERYNACPYQHFVRYGIKPREDTSYDINRMEKGNILHEMAQKLVSNKMQNKEEDLAHIFDEAASNNINEYRLENKRNLFFLDRIKKDSLKAFESVERQLDISRPDRIFTEIKYGQDQLFPAVKFSYEGQEIRVEGKIDRIDEFDLDGKKYFRIIDYKSSYKDFDIGKIYKGIDFQLMVYLYSAVSSADNAKPLGAFYINLNPFSSKDKLEVENLSERLLKHYRMKGISLDKGEVLERVDLSFDNSKAYISDLIEFSRGKGIEKKDNAVDEDFFQALFSHILASANDTINDIKRGKISVRPYSLNGVSPCEYCAYKAICQEEIENINYIDKYNWKKVKEDLGVKNG